MNGQRTEMRIKGSIGLSLIGHVDVDYTIVPISCQLDCDLTRAFHLCLRCRFHTDSDACLVGERIESVCDYIVVAILIVPIS